MRYLFIGYQSVNGLKKFDIDIETIDRAKKQAMFQ